VKKGVVVPNLPTQCPFSVLETVVPSRWKARQEIIPPVALEPSEQESGRVPGPESRVALTTACQAGLKSDFASISYTMQACQGLSG